MCSRGRSASSGPCAVNRPNVMRFERRVSSVLSDKPPREPQSMLSDSRLNTLAVCQLEHSSVRQESWVSTVTPTYGSQLLAWRAPGRQRAACRKSLGVVAMFSTHTAYSCHHLDFEQPHFPRKLGVRPTVNLGSILPEAYPCSASAARDSVCTGSTAEVGSRFPRHPDSKNNDD